MSKIKCLMLSTACLVLFAGLSTELSAKGPLPTFTVELTPEIADVGLGRATVLNVTVRSVNGFSGPVYLRHKGELAGLDLFFLTGDSVNVTPTSPGLAMLAAITSTPLGAGEFPVGVEGSDKPFDVPGQPANLPNDASTINVFDIDLFSIKIEPEQKQVANGEILPLKLVVGNQGQSDSGAVNYRIYLSADAKITTSDSLAFVGVIGNVPGNTRVKLGSLAFPDQLPAGKYYVGIFLDTLDAIDETDEGNNIGVSTSQVEITP